MGDTDVANVDDLRKHIDGMIDKQKEGKVCEYAKPHSHNWVTRFYCNSPELKELLKEYGTLSIQCHNHNDTSGYQGGCENFKDCGKTLYNMLHSDK